MVSVQTMNSLGFPGRGGLVYMTERDLIGRGLVSGKRLWSEFRSEGRR